jgi:hypothetical protein
MELHNPKPSAGKLLEMDVIRCRRSAPYENAHPVPVFSVYDDIHARTAEELYDFQYIDKRPQHTEKVSLTALRYTGPRWYPRVAAEFMLRHAKVEWTHFKFFIDATGHLPADALEAMERAWADPDLAKLSVNAALGILGAPQAYSYRLKSGDVPEAASGAYEVMTQYGEDVVTDYVWQTKLLTNRSYRPIFDQAVYTEHVRVAQALYCITKLGLP